MRVFDRFLRWCPGALGLVLRGRLYPSRFHSCGKGVLIGRFVDIRGAEKISLGRKVVISDGVVLDGTSCGRGGPGIVLEDDVFIGSGTTLAVTGGGTIHIGRGSNFSSCCVVAPAGSFRMGSDCLVAGYCRFGSIGSQRDDSGDIAIGDGCWLGVRLTVLPGTEVGGASILGAHGVVQGKIEPYSVAVGNPAEVIKVRGKG